MHPTRVILFTPLSFQGNDVVPAHTAEFKAFFTTIHFYLVSYVGFGFGHKETATAIQIVQPFVIHITAVGNQHTAFGEIAVARHIYFRAPFVDPLTATAPAVLEIFSNPDKYAGKSLLVIGDMISPQEMVETFVRVTGKKAKYSSAFSRDEELLHHFPEFSSNEDLVREILGMAEYAFEYGYFGKDRDWLWSRQINPDSLNWEQFLRTTGWQGQKLSY